MINQEDILQKETQYGTKERTAQKEGEDPTGNASKTPDTISDLLLERDMQAFQHKEKISKEKVIPENTNPQSTQKGPEARRVPKDSGSPSAEDKTDNTSGSSQEDNPSPDIETIQKEVEKARQELESTKRWGHANSQKVKKAVLKTQEFIEEGSLSEEEGQTLLVILNASSSTPSPFEEDDEVIAETQKTGKGHLFAQLFPIANRELDNIRTYGNDDLLDEKVKAFDYFLSVATPSEREETIEVLMDLKDQPVALAKKMLSLGQKCYEDFYKSLQEAGGLRAYQAKKKKDIQILNQKIDKLTKKLAQYEDYDRPTYGISEMGSSEKDKPVLDTITGLFSERDRIVGNQTIVARR